MAHVPLKDTWADFKVLTAFSSSTIKFTYMTMNRLCFDFSYCKCVKKQPLINSISLINSNLMIKHEFIYSKFQLTHKVLFEIWEADRLNINILFEYRTLGGNAQVLTFHWLLLLLMKIKAAILKSIWQILLRISQKKTNKKKTTKNSFNDNWLYHRVKRFLVQYL